MYIEDILLRKEMISLSGGYFNYNYGYLDVYEGEMEDTELNELLLDFKDLLHELEWYKSGDTSQEDYERFVKYFKDRWIRGEDRDGRFLNYVEECLTNLKKQY